MNDRGFQVSDIKTGQLEKSVMFSLEIIGGLVLAQ